MRQRRDRRKKGREKKGEKGERRVDIKRRKKMGERRGNLNKVDG